MNRQVAGLLNKLLIEFTKSRANRTTDNALVEGKNGAILRKHMGYEHIAGEHAEQIQKVYTAHFNRYLNYHASMRICDGDDGSARKTETGVQDCRLCDAVREAEIAAEIGEVFEGRDQFRKAGRGRESHERHRVRRGSCVSSSSNFNC